jgi:hypothetical protein
MRSARLLLSIVLLTAILIGALPVKAAPQAQDQPAVITAPRDGDRLTGVVQIMGTATHGKFDHYELAWASQSAPDNWQMIAVVQNQIVNGSLGTWDTAQLPPGVYRLRLRVVREGDKSTDFIVNNLSINQGTPTPVASPTPPIGPTIPPSPTPGAVAATPTVVIVQPPTSTPQPAATKSGAAAVATPSGPRTPSVQVNFASFGQMFCNGALYTFLAFLVWGVVLSLRGIARWVLREMRRAVPRRQ